MLRFLFYICFARGRTGWLLVSLLYIHDSSSLYVTTIARQGIMAMNPLSYTEHKLKATKIITVNNTPDQRISSKTPFEHTPRVTIIHVQICTTYCTKAFGGWVLPRATRGSLQRSPDPLTGLRGREGRGREREMKGRWQYYLCVQADTNHSL